MRKKAMKISGDRMPALPWRGLLAGCFLLFFLLGILAANWVGREKLLQYGMLNDYYIGQLAYAKLDLGEYFGYLIKRRIRIFGLVSLLVYTRFGAFALAGAIGWYAFSLGYLFVDGLVIMKFQGMLLVLLSVFPQIFFYAAAYFGLGKILFGKNLETAMPIGKIRVWGNPRLFLLLSAFLCMAAGIWLEAYANPTLLKSFIRRM